MELVYGWYRNLKSPHQRHHANQMSLKQLHKLLKVSPLFVVFHLNAIYISTVYSAYCLFSDCPNKNNRTANIERENCARWKYYTFMIHDACVYFTHHALPFHAAHFHVRYYLESNTPWTKSIFIIYFFFYLEWWSLFAFGYGHNDLNAIELWLKCVKLLASGRRKNVKKSRRCRLLFFHPFCRNNLRW